ncbi:MAG TPA: hypothetical protein VGI79_16990 [Caulobacteraceae bacterium]|jgi:hypothetical protein
MLKELGEMGMDLTRALHVQGLESAEEAAQETAVSPGMAERGRQIMAAFAQAARTVRQTMALEVRLKREFKAREAQAQGALAPASASPATAEDWRAKERVYRGAIRRAVALETLEPAIRAEAREDEHEQLLADLDEQLDGATAEADFIDQTPTALIKRIRRDLGLAEDPGERPDGMATPLQSLHLLKPGGRA